MFINLKTFNKTVYTTWLYVKVLYEHDSIQANGALTKGENFRDMLALHIAYDVSEHWLLSYSDNFKTSQFSAHVFSASVLLL